MPTGNDLLKLAETRIGEKYFNVLVPKDNPNWHGPWDCAEFASWVVYQKAKKLYGCTDNKGNPQQPKHIQVPGCGTRKMARLNLSDQTTANNTAG